MSTSSKNLSSFNCPGCSQALWLTGLSDGQSISCSQCGFKATPSLGKQSLYDGRAKLSLVLGLVSLVFGFLTGIPAAIIGIKVLKRIRRGEASVKGSQFARVGVALGATSTLATFLLVATVATVVVVAFRNSSINESEDVKFNAETMWFARYFPALPKGVEVQTSINAMDVIRMVRMSDEEKSGQSNIELNLVQMRRGLLVISNEVLAIQLQDQAKKDTRIESTEKIYLRNSHGTYALSRIDGASKRSKGRQMKTFYATVPIENQAIIVQLVLYQTNHQQPDDQIDAGSDPVSTTTDEPEAEFLFTNEEIIEFFKQVG